MEAARKLREHRRLSTTTTHRHLMATQDVKVAKVTEARRRGEAVRAAQDTAESIAEAERVATVASNAAQNAQTKAEAHAAEVAAVSVAEKERRAETSAKRQEMVERRSSGNVRTSWAGGGQGGRGGRDHTLSLNSFSARGYAGVLVYIVFVRTHTHTPYAALTNAHSTFSPPLFPPPRSLLSSHLKVSAKDLEADAEAARAMLEANRQTAAEEQGRKVALLESTARAEAHTARLAAEAGEARRAAEAAAGEEEEAARLAVEAEAARRVAEETAAAHAEDARLLEEEVERKAAEKKVKAEAHAEALNMEATACLDELLERGVTRMELLRCLARANEDPFDEHVQDHSEIDHDFVVTHNGHGVRRGLNLRGELGDLNRPYRFGRLFAAIAACGRGTEYVDLAMVQDFEAKDRVLRGIFDLLDVDHGGAVEKVEVLGTVRKASEQVRELLKSTAGLEPLLRPQSLFRTFMMMDTDADGHITYEEFRMFCLVHQFDYLSPPTSRQLQESHASQYISTPLRRGPRGEAKRALRQVFDLADKDQSGT